MRTPQVKHKQKPLYQ